MKEQEKELPDRRYERSMNHNYLVLSTYQFFVDVQEESYIERMLLENQIPGLLPVISRHKEGEKQYCYEINSLQSLDRLYEKQEMSYEALQKLLTGCIRCFERLEEYLLDGSQVLLLPEYIYVHMDTKEPYFVCYPNYDGDVRKTFQKLVDYLLTKIDHKQERAVWLAYQVYRYTRNSNYVLGEIKNLLYEAQEMEQSVTYRENSNYANGTILREDFCNTNLECSIQESNDFYENSAGEKYGEKYSLENVEKEVEPDNWNKNILGALLCTLLALSAGGIIFGARLLKLIPLSQKQEISLYGAIGMSVVAAGIFFVSVLKKWKQDEKIQQLTEEVEDEIEYWNTDVRIVDSRSMTIPNEKKNYVRNVTPMQMATGKQTSELAGETMLLNQEVVQERCLKGMVNGKELRIPLAHFPLTIGKLAPFCDVVIPDNTVSRMHARLEERNGQVFISDLNSTNGTIRNGDMLSIHEEVAMEPGDQIMFGRVCLTYC